MCVCERERERERWYEAHQEGLPSGVSALRERVTDEERGVALEKETRNLVEKVRVTGWFSSTAT